MSEPTTKAGRALHDWLGWHPIDGRDDRILAIEVEAYERGCVAGMAMEKYAPQPDTASRELREALDQIRQITKPFSMTMRGPQWFSGDTDIFGGGNREKVWRIADAAIAEGVTPAPRPAPEPALREALDFIADWAHDCQDPDGLDDYGFADIEKMARAALDAFDE